MIKRIELGRITSGIIAGLMLSPGAFAGEFTDDFSSGTLEAKNWSTPAYVRNITPGEKFWSKYSQSNIDGGYSRNRLRTHKDIGDGLYEVKALINVKDIAFANNSTSVFARIEGLFYDSALGLVWTALYIGDQGTGMVAWWAWDEGGGSKGTGDIVGLTPTKNKEYYVKIFYDGDNTFTYTIADKDGTTNLFSETTDGPARAGPPTSKSARLSTGANFDVGGNGSAAYIEAEFDIAEVKWNDGSPRSFIDDFTGDALNSDNWRDDTAQAIVEEQGGPLVVTVAADGNARRHSAHVTLADTTQNCLYAEATWHGDSNIPDTTADRGRVRVLGHWYNDTYDGAGYNGVEGNVFAFVAIENEPGGGVLRAATWAGRVDDADFTTETELFWHRFNTIPVEGSSYPMFIELDKANKQLKMHFNGETYTHDITTPVYDASPEDEYRAIQLRVQDQDSDDGEDAEGFLRADFAKVFSGAKCPTGDDDFLLLLMPAILGAVK